MAISKSASLLAAVFAPPVPPPRIRRPCCRYALQAQTGVYLRRPAGRLRNGRLGRPGNFVGLLSSATANN